MTIGIANVRIVFSLRRQHQQRALWIAQELIAAFGDELGEVRLDPTSRRMFSISCDWADIWEHRDGALPDAEIVTDRVRRYIETYEAGAFFEPRGRPATADSANSARSGRNPLARKCLLE